MILFDSSLCRTRIVTENVLLKSNIYKTQCVDRPLQAYFVERNLISSLRNLTQVKLRWDETRRDYDPDLQARISLPKQARNDPAIKG